ncbi:putative protein N(5)-glutamine methyltransferase [Nocardioides bruguierae]|uniref:Release factor glutamine methyltransferase n=1 Tax=Nocardioides bruguierae TaxID=2945102 RepID=A0A9X2IFN4_9ACTN|nr:putative protein N(5)-glutamine methyltransferase [Nocardioides bruguierae]MCM0621502.1 putative protein N(5)-glutamine methyltransferase [Nocardioides bruguierae]
MPAPAPAPTPAPTPAPDPLVARLRAAGCVFAEDEAALLRGTGAEPEALEGLVARRVAGEPLEVLLGWAEVDGVRVRTAAGVFVPRRRSLLLARAAAAHLAGRDTPTVLLDLCCGTGALARLVLALLERGGHPAPAQVHAADLDPLATACAAANLPGAQVHTGDLLDALPETLRGHVDALVVNAPYVPTDALADLPPEAREHEPRHALDGGADGLDLHRRVAAHAAEWLAPEGLLVLECAPGQQATAVRALEQGGLTATLLTDEELGATGVAGVLPR